MKRERSTAYPVLDLSVAWRMLRRDLRSLGLEDLSREEFAKCLGHEGAEGGVAARKIGALVQFGFVDRRSGRYGLSPLGLRLKELDPQDVEFAAAIRSALIHPVLFSAILRRFQSKGQVPSDLASELFRFGITDRASEDAARIFSASALFARVIDSVGRIKVQRLVDDFDESFTADEATLPRPLEATAAEQGHSIELLLASGKKAKLELPAHFSQADFAALKDSFQTVYRRLPTYIGLSDEAKPPSGRKEEVDPGPGQPLPFGKVRRRRAALKGS